MAAGQTNWPYVINLGNSIIGVSVLAMPFCFKECGVILGLLLLVCSGWLTHISCKLLVKAAFQSRRRSYQYLAFHAVGPAGKLFVEICMIGLLLGTCVAFYVIMGDLGPAIVSKIVGIENTDNLRTGMLIVMAVCISLPLTLLRNLESLSNVNAISIGFYAVFIAEVFSAAFPNLWSGLWVTRVSYWKPEGVFKCLPIFSLAFSCQTQLFVMYDALAEPSLQRMTHITKSAIGMCMFVYMCVGFFGYVAFCDDEVLGDILLSFHPTIFSEAVKFGFVLAVAVSFPLMVFPCRASIYTLCFAKAQTSHDNITGSVIIPPFHFNMITGAIVMGTLVIGILIPNIEFVLAMTGATMGSLICYIFPAIMFISIMSMTKTNNKTTAQFVLFLGVTILLASTYVTLNSQVTQAMEMDTVVKVLPHDDLPLVPGDQVDEIPIQDSAVDQQAGDPGGGEKVKRDGPDDTENKEDEDGKVPDQDDNAEDSDKRHEPPNPQAPRDVDSKEDALGDETNLEVDKKEEGAEAAKPDTDEAKPADQEDKPVEKEGEEASKVKDDVKDDGKDDTEKVEEKKAEDVAEANNLLKELKEQQEVQKQLIEEQKEIIEDLKQHQKEAHGEGVKDADQSLNNQVGQPADPQPVAQQQPVVQQPAVPQMPAQPAQAQQVPVQAQPVVQEVAQQAQPAVQQVQQLAVQEPVVQQVQQSIGQQPIAQQAQQPIVQQVVAQQPIVQQEVVQKQVVKQMPVEQQLKPVDPKLPAQVVMPQPTPAPAPVQNPGALSPDLNDKLNNIGNIAVNQQIEQGANHQKPLAGAAVNNKQKLVNKQTPVKVQNSPVVGGKVVASSNSKNIHHET